MDMLSGAIPIIMVCGLVVLIGIVKSKMEWVITFILRAVFGMVAIYGINYFMTTQQLTYQIGINPVTILTSGILGFPGLILLYGIAFL